MKSSPRRRPALLTSLICAVAIVLAVPGRSFAGGEEYSASQDDILLAINSKWAGGQSGGYYPIRVAMRNHGPTRTLTVNWKPDTSGMPVISRSVTVDQNSSASFTLLAPLVGHYNGGSLHVFHDGQELKKLQHSVTLPEMSHQTDWPSMLVISDKVVDASGFGDAVVSVLGSGSSGHYYGASATEADLETVSATLLPDTWLAYSGLDFVSVSLETLESLAEEQRSAMLEWMRTGGTLLIHSVGEAASASSKLRQVTGLAQQKQRVEWTSPNVTLRRVVQLAVVDQWGNITYEADSAPQFQWDAEPDRFAITESGLGRIVAFKDSPYGGTVHDWAWLLNSLPKERLTWAKRHGASGRDENQEFLAFLIPGVKTVPAMAFLIFISVFTCVIGPLNYFMLSSRKRLNFLVVTIPVIAAATSILLFGYSLVAHGISVRSRVRSVTLIDQGSQQAISMSRLALYAGLAPSDGLRFSTATEVVPIWPQGTTFTQGRVDWTENQNLAAGFLRSRTRTQFLTTAVRAERGRLNVSRPTSDSLNVTNGLEWDLEALLVSDAEGNRWFASGVAAGSDKKLSPLSPAARNEMTELLERSAPSVPDEIDGSNMMFGPWNPRFMYGRNTSHLISTGQMEATVSAIRKMVGHAEPATPNIYIAVCRQAPGIEFGTDVKVIDGWHVVMGHY